MRFSRMLFAAAIFVLAGCGTIQRFSSYPAESFEYRTNTYHMRDNTAERMIHVQPFFGDSSQRIATEAAAAFISGRHPGCKTGESALFSADGTFAPSYEVKYTC